MQTLAKVFESLSDDQSLDLFRTIANDNISSIVLRNKVELTRKQYYSRLSRMAKAGLIKRKNGKLALTAFGKIVYEVHKTIENAFNNQWKLKVIDSIEYSDELPKDERKKLVENLIENEQIREILSQERAEQKSAAATHADVVQQ